MGCGNSKVEDLPAVALCRERCNYLNDAIQHRYAFAESHVSYIHSLRRIGHSLHNFIHLDYYGGLPSSSVPLPLSPKLNLPFRRKGDPIDDRGGGGGGSSSPKKAHLPPPHHSHSHSHSGSHLNFHSDSDDDDDDDEISHLHHSDHSSPLHHLGTPPFGGGGGGHIQYMSSDYLQQDQDSVFPGGGGGFLHMNYMKNKAAPPSVVYQQRPKSPETVRFGDPSTSSSSAAYYYGPPPDNSYPPNNNNSMPYPYNDYPNYGPGGMGGFYGAQPPPAYGSPSPGAAASSSKSPPPPPSPPKASGWDFLNLFEGADDFPYPPYTPGRNSRDVREEEGIPELEDDNYHYQREVVKEVHGAQKFVHGVSSGYNSNPIMTDDGVDGKLGGDDAGGGGEAEASLYQTRPSTSMENEGVEHGVRVVDKTVVNDEERGNGGGFKGRPRDVSEVAFEIKIQFERASECGNEIAKMLEVGTLRYHRKHVSKMLHVVASSSSMVSSQPSTSKGTEASSSAPPHLEIDEDLAMRSKNLSSTLHKLHLWEKKLYNEVKAEEKMRVVHDRKCRKLKRLDERGAEAHKVDATRTLIRSLSSKIRMAIQVVDKISITINKIRDEELWPQLNELIQGLSRMWRNMLECHRNQCQAIREVKSLGSIGFSKKFSDAHLEAALQLEHEVINWTATFSSWVGAQKNYVRALNKWLVNCLCYEPEDTPDGPVPFSPGRIGAPPVFVICNQWAQAMERISEKEVIEAMRVFSRSVLQLWEQDVLEMRQRMMANKDLERKVRDLDREDQKIHKEIQALDKKIVLFAGDGGNLSITRNVVYQSDTGNVSLEGSMQLVFEAIEKFVGDSMKAYEELIQRSEEETLAREHEGAS